MVRIKVKFNHRATFRVYDEFNGDITKDDEGNLYTEIDIPNSDTLYNYIFSFGNYVEVLAPEEVRLHIKNLVNKIADKYKT